MTHRPRRVLIIVENLPVPFDRRVWLEATTLARHGDRVSVICPKAKGFNASHEILEDVAIYRYSIPFEAAGALGFLLEFAWCFVAIGAAQPLDRRIRPRLRRAARLQPARHVLAARPVLAAVRPTLHLRPSRPLPRDVRRQVRPQLRARCIARLLWLERQSMQAADVVITTNASHKAIAISRGGRSPEDVIVVRSGPDLNRFRRLSA